MRNNLTRLEIIHALVALDAECAKRGIAGEICIYGGAGMVLVFDARQSTRDVDAVFRPKVEIRTAAEAVAAELGLPLNWLNDGVKGFLSENEETRRISIPDLEALQNIRIVWPTPEYLLAMKCMAARSDDTSMDKEDVVFLLRQLGITSEEQALEIVERFFPKDRIHIKTHFFITENLESLKQSEGKAP
jgi:hypothetical protein